MPTRSKWPWIIALLGLVISQANVLFQVNTRNFGPFRINVLMPGDYFLERSDWVTEYGWPRRCFTHRYATWKREDYDRPAQLNVHYSPSVEEMRAYAAGARRLSPRGEMAFAEQRDAALARIAAMPLGSQWEIHWPVLLGSLAAWMAFWVVVPHVLFAVGQRLRALFRRQAGQCPKCKYDIRASLEFGRCPECGQAL